MADHAGREEGRGESGDLHADRHYEAAKEDDGRPAERGQEGGTEESAVVEAVALEAEDEGGEIQAERQDPEEGDRGDFLAHLVGRRHEHHGAAGGEGEPEEEIRDW